MGQVTETFVRDCLPVRDRDGHKGTFGKVHILAGSVGFTGAPIFASHAAVRTGFRKRSGLWRRGRAGKRCPRLCHPSLSCWIR